MLRSKVRVILAILIVSILTGCGTLTPEQLKTIRKAANVSEPKRLLSDLEYVGDESGVLYISKYLPGTEGLSIFSAINNTDPLCTEQHIPRCQGIRLLVDTLRGVLGKGQIPNSIHTILIKYRGYLQSGYIKCRLSRLRLLELASTSDTELVSYCYEVRTRSGRYTY